jgi:hypothetical protein
MINLEKIPTKFVSPEGLKVTVAHNAEKEGVNEDDTEFQIAIFSQVVAALNAYPQEKRFNHHIFHPFVFLFDKEKSHYLIGSVTGAWVDHAHEHVYTFKEILIHDLCKTGADFQQLASAIQTFNPGVPKAGSESFIAKREAGQ